MSRLAGSIDVTQLCPCCMSELEPDEGDDFGHICPRCGEDISTREAVSMDREAYGELPRRSCFYCTGQLLEGATVCPHCQSPEPE